MSSPFINFTREEWSGLRASTPLTLSEDDVEEIRGINVALSMGDVEQSYLPLSRLLNLYVRASQQLFSVMDTFLGKPTAPVPYIIGIAGSVAVGKSTTARVLQELLSRWPDHPSVDLITTDGFLLPNAELQRRGLMERKGFPESFDRKALLEFVAALKSGVDAVSAPVYSHITYDIVPDKKRVVSHPDIVIIEGLNVLQGGDTGTYVSDYFDFSIYVDAEVADIERWYVERFHTFTRTAFRREDSYFRQYAELTEAEAEATAQEIWKSINEVNLFENILHTRERATLILRKDGDHQTEQIKLRRP